MHGLANLGHSVTVITSDSNHLAETPRLLGKFASVKVDGLELYWIRTLKFKRAKSFRRILSWIHFEWGVLRLPFRKLSRPDIIIASSLSLLSILTGAFLSRKYGARLVFEIRDIWPLTIVEEGGFGRRNPFVLILGAIERFGYRHADMIVGTMPNLGEHVFSVLGEHKPVHCIPMGYVVNHNELPVSLPLAYLEANVPTEKFLIGYMGTIGVSNALNTLFKCAEAMADDLGIHFVIVGDGDLRKQYMSLYSHLPNVTFVRKVPKESVQKILMQFDLLYFSVHDSAVWKYGQSLNKIIDYMLSGTPVVGSYSGYPSMINEAQSGTFVPADNFVALATEIKRLSSIGRKERTEMGLRGHRWLILNRNYEKLSREFEGILQSLNVPMKRET